MLDSFFVTIRPQALSFLTPILGRGFASLLAVSSLARAAPDAAFASALVDLQRARAETQVLGTTLAQVSAMNDKFFDRVPLASLGPEEIAELTRLNAFAYGSEPQARAKAAADQLAASVTAPDVKGALAASLRVQLSRPAGIKGDERAQWIAVALHHPAYEELVRGDFGGIALDVGCLAGMRDPAYRDAVTAIAGKLNPAFSAAVSGVAHYWTKIEQAIPAGEQRQLLRGQLAAYVAGVLERKDAALTSEGRAKAEALLANLNSVAARGGSLEGQLAPELHFLWSSEANWKNLSDLCGKVVVLEFWATWCGVCVKAFPEVAALAERYRGSDVVVVGVTSLQGAIMGLGPKAEDCRGDPQKEMRLMADYMRAKQITWPVVFSREPAINPDYGLRGIPSTVVIAPDGTVRYLREGFVQAALGKQIDAVLQEFQLRQPTARATK
jgi:thiol-disulfide isomerase/thioredoxin